MSGTYHPYRAGGAFAGSRQSKTQMATELGPCVYYVRTRDDLVKIGYTANLAHRISAYGGYTSLLAVQQGTLDEESALHGQFHPYIGRGSEYYHPVPILLDHIDRVRNAFALPPIERWSTPGAIFAQAGVPQPPLPRPSRLLDTAAAAAAGGVDVTTVRRWVATGRLPNHGKGKVVRVGLDELRALLTE